MRGKGKGKNEREREGWEGRDRWERKGKGDEGRENERQRRKAIREKDEINERETKSHKIENEIAMTKKKNQRSLRTCNRPYKWYSPHSVIDIAPNIKVGNIRKRT
jgi:hypothetical protein